MEPQQNGPLADVHAYLKGKDKSFTADLPTFEKDMQDDGVRQQVYDYLKGQDKEFTASFDEFSDDLGVKKKPHPNRPHNFLATLGRVAHRWGNRGRAWVRRLLLDPLVRVMG